jgi:multicomponent Na+:H+ antiporter subunit A
VMVGGIAVTVPDVTFAEGMVLILAITGAVIAAASQSRVLAIAGLGTAGFAIAMLFVLLGAPDLAMTQLLVETLVVIVILLVMKRLPSFVREQRSMVNRGRDIAVAGLAGGVIALVMLAILQVPFDPTISEYYAEMSWPAAHGRNIVNVILVDFRALDTLGEIVVLAAAGLGALALLRARKGAARGTDVEGTP